MNIDENQPLPEDVQKLSEENNLPAECGHPADFNSAQIADGAELPENAQATKHKAAKPRREKMLSVQDSKLTKNQRILKSILRWVFILLGAVMMAASVYFFQEPNHFTLGGMAGIAIVLEQFIVPHIKWMNYTVIMAILNVLLLILGLIVLGKECTVRTVVCSLVYIGITLLLKQVLPLDKPVTSQYVRDELGQIMLDAAGNPMHTGEQLFMELCYGILLFGMGGALIFSCGASSGGTDIIALILKKFTKLNVGIALMIVDMIVLFVSIFTFQSVTIALYSFLGLFAKSFLLDGVIESMGKTAYITIITTHHDLIAPIILKDINHGFTMYDAEGGYTGEKKKVLTTVCKRGEAIKLKTLVKKADPCAFVIITNTNEIMGKGFEAEI